MISPTSLPTLAKTTTVEWGAGLMSVGLFVLPVLLVLLASPQSVFAQTTLDGAPPTSPGASVATSGVDGDDLGADTRRLLALQVSGRVAAPGPIQSMPGDEATVAYKRYLDSFSHAVPEFFEQKVKSNAGS